MILINNNHNKMNKINRKLILIQIKCNRNYYKKLILINSISYNKLMKRSLWIWINDKLSSS